MNPLLTSEMKGETMMDARATKTRWTPWRAIAIGTALSLLFFFVIVIQRSSALEAPTEGRPSRTVSKPASTGSSGGKDAQILSRLDEILANQRTILEKFDAIMEELRIIKVRATPKS